MRAVVLSVIAACGAAPKGAYVAPVASSSSSVPPIAHLDGAELHDRYDSIEAFCAPIAEEAATPSNDACEHEHGSCSAERAKDVSPFRASVVSWNRGSSIDRREDVAIETARGVFFIGLETKVKTCDPEEEGPPNGPVSLAIDHGVLVVTYDAFQRSIHFGPDSPPSKKRTCTVRCEARDVPRCGKPQCGEWSDVD